MFEHPNKYKGFSYQSEEGYVLPCQPVEERSSEQSETLHTQMRQDTGMLQLNKTNWFCDKR